MAREGWTGMALAPNEPTRAELTAQLATATASVQQLRADVELATAQRDAEACHRDDADAEAERVTRELAVLRAQQAPLVACVDALRAAARDAGWRDADATGETLVAWVRRGALLDAARIALERGGERVAKAIVARANEEGGE